MVASKQVVSTQFPTWILEESPDGGSKAWISLKFLLPHEDRIPKDLFVTTIRLPLRRLLAVDENIHSLDENGELLKSLPLSSLHWSLEKKLILQDFFLQHIPHFLINMGARSANLAQCIHLISESHWRIEEDSIWLIPLVAKEVDGSMTVLANLRGEAAGATSKDPDDGAYHRHTERQALNVLLAHIAELPLEWEDVDDISKNEGGVTFHLGIGPTGNLNFYLRQAYLASRHHEKHFPSEHSPVTPPGYFRSTVYGLNLTTIQESERLDSILMLRSPTDRRKLIEEIFEQDKKTLANILEPKHGQKEIHTPVVDYKRRAWVPEQLSPSQYNPEDPGNLPQIPILSLGPEDDSLVARHLLDEWTALNEKIMKIIPKDEDIPESKKQFYKDWKNKIDGLTKSFYNDAQEHIQYNIDSKPAAVEIPPGNNEDSALDSSAEVDSVNPGDRPKKKGAPTYADISSPIGHHIKTDSSSSSRAAERRKRHNLPQLADPFSHNRRAPYGLPIQDLDDIANKRLNRRPDKHFESTGRRLDLNDMGDQIAAFRGFGTQTLPWVVDTANDFGEIASRHIHPYPPPEALFLPVQTVVETLARSQRQDPVHGALNHSAFSSAEIRNFTFSFPNLPTQVNSELKTRSDRLLVLGFLTRVSKYCASYGFYVPPPSALDPRNPGTDRYQLYLHEKWTNRTTDDGQLRELIASCLQQKLGKIPSLTRGVSMATRDVSRALHAICQTLRHPGLSPVPLALPESFPSQRVTDSLLDYIDRATDHLHYHYLAGYAFSDRYFLRCFVDHMHPSVRDTMGRRLLDRMNADDISYRRYKKMELSEALPQCFWIDNLGTLFRESQAHLGASIDYTDAPSSFLRSSQPRPTTVRQITDSPAESVASVPSSTDIDTPFDFDDEAQCVYAVMQHQKKTPTCVCCGEESHLVLDCTKFKELIRRFKTLSSKALKKKLYYELVGSSTAPREHTIREMVAVDSSTTDSSASASHSTPQEAPNDDLPSLYDCSHLDPVKGDYISGDRPDFY